MSVKVESVALTPNIVNVGEQFVISVKLQPTTYERLVRWTHTQLAKFTHKNFAEDLIK